MKVNRAIPIIGLGAAALFLLSNVARAAASATLNFIPSGVGFYSASRLWFKVRVQNPSNTSLTLRALAGNLSINGNTIGNLSMFTPVTVVAVSETTVTLEMTVSLLGSVALLYDVLLNKNPVRVQVSFNGTANVNGTVVPLKLNFKIV